MFASREIEKPHYYHWSWNNHQSINFYHQDVLGSVVMLTDKYGQMAERYQYDVWGKAYEGRFKDGFPGYGNGQDDNVYGFTGQRYQPELGVYSFAYRDYNPRTMRWLTEDPVKDGENWFLYCQNDPVNYIDLLGLDVIVLNDSDAVDLPGGPYGHNAVLVGNEEDGYDYYSKEGKTPDQAVEETTEKGNTHAQFESLDDFYARSEVSERYDRSVTIETTKDQDAAMKEKADEVYDKSYNFFLENCADLVEKTAKAGGVDLSKGNVLGIDIPNKQLEAAEKIAAEPKNSAEQKSKK